MVVNTTICLLGTVGNGLVIYFAAFRMKRTVTIVWFLNLAIADFAFTFSLLMDIVYDALGAHWPFGTFMCKLNSTFDFINLFASIFLLTVISLDRCISVLFPVWCRNHRTPKLASFVVLGVWMLAIVFSLPYFIFRDTKKINGKVECFMNYNYDMNVNRAFSRHLATVITRFIIGFAVPFILIISCYSIILLRIHRNHMTTSSKPFKVVIAVINSFFVCWFPYHVFSFVVLAKCYNSNCHFSYALQIAGVLSSTLAFVNSCVNPILYVFMGGDFKENMWTSFQTIFEKAFKEEYVQLDS
ncbi:chemerin-like receptor 1 [Hyperolius riggenbachi]|uniref:chemerin-like receptor 1 n=1 Tax=Hyperolius riggenbachi TaxID=752182 RepID=UPI0035A3C805